MPQPLNRPEEASTYYQPFSIHDFEVSLLCVLLTRLVEGSIDPDVVINIAVSLNARRTCTLHTRSYREL